jgi:hypothetical protein
VEDKDLDGQGIDGEINWRCNRFLNLMCEGKEVIVEVYFNAIPVLCSYIITAKFRCKSVFIYQDKLECKDGILRYPYIRITGILNKIQN